MDLGAGSYVLAGRGAEQADGGDFAQEGECAAATGAGERFGLGEFGRGFGIGSEQEADVQGRVAAELRKP